MEDANGFYKDGRFDDFLSLLKSVDRKDKGWGAVDDYFAALTRYKQLAYLEQNQQWEQYFNQGGAYRGEIGQALERCLKAATASDQVSLYARLLSLQAHIDQNGASPELVTSFVDSAKKFSETAKDFEPLKIAADTLMSYSEKRAAKELYGIYLEKISSSGMSDAEIAAMGRGFLKDGNIDLAESACDIYLKRLQAYASDKSVPAMLEVASLFAYKDRQVNDPFYAEKVFALAEKAGGAEAFDADTLYLRAFNLEQAGECAAAREQYQILVKRFPDGARVSEAQFKAAIFYAYWLKDIKSAREQFELLANSGSAAPEAVQALYQLGLLKQWEKDNEGARQYYAKAQEKAGANFPETAALCQARLKEIESGKELEYGLKIFLDASLGNNQSDMSKVQIEPVSTRLKKGEGEEFNSHAQPAESGCTAVTLSYFWVGDLGSASPDSQQSGFKSTYNEPGTKMVGLAVMSQTGLLDRAFRMVVVE